MNCSEFDIALHQYFIGEMDPTKTDDLDAHAAACQRCQGLMRTAHELTCKEFVEFLGDYLDGELAPERREIFERHLGICPECTAYLQTYRRTLELAGEAGREPGGEVVRSMPDELVRGARARGMAG